MNRRAVDIVYTFMFIFRYEDAVEEEKAKTK